MEYAHSLAVAARLFAKACDKAVDLPRPAAERARALAEEIEAIVAADANSRVVLAEYAKSLAVIARHFVRACDAVELPRAVAERARSLTSEIETLLGR